MAGFRSIIFQSRFIWFDFTLRLLFSFCSFYFLHKFLYSFLRWVCYVKGHRFLPFPLEKRDPRIIMRMKSSVISWQNEIFDGSHGFCGNDASSHLAPAAPSTETLNLVIKSFASSWLRLWVCRIHFPHFLSQSPCNKNQPKSNRVRSEISLVKVLKFLRR